MAIENEKENAIDYRNLLIKYIEHVFQCEGSTFIYNVDNSDFFTENEKIELRALENEPII